MAKKKLKQASSVSSSVSSSDRELETRMTEAERRGRIEVGQRIVQIRGEKSQAEFASWLRVVHKNTLARYERGEIMPSSDFLVALNVADGINPAWVLLGDVEGGPVRTRDAARFAPLDRGALRDVVQVVEEFLQERGLHLEPSKKAELLVLIYEDVREHDGKVDRARVIRLVNLAA